MSAAGISCLVQPGPKPRALFLKKSPQPKDLLLNENLVFTQHNDAESGGKYRAETTFQGGKISLTSFAVRMA